MLHAIGKVSPQHIDTYIGLALDEKILLKGELAKNNEQLLTTQPAIDLERDSLARLNAGKGQLTPLLTGAKAQEALREYGLNAEQYQAALLLLTTKDRIVGIQGYAGTGKTSSLRATQKIARTEISVCLSVLKILCGYEGLEIQGIAPSATAAKQLAASAGIPSQTLAGFLIKQPHERAGSLKKSSPALWIVDEASMVSSRQMNILIQIAEQRGAHLVLVGDTQQLLAIESGKPFAQMQKAGMQTACLTQIKRQTNPLLLSSVKDSIRGDVSQALGKNGHNLIEISDKQLRLSAVAQAWLSLDTGTRQKTLVITPQKTDRTAVNDLIRSGLKAEGRLADNGRNSIILSQENLTQVEKYRVTNYETGMILKFGAALEHSKIKAHTYWQVSHIDKESNSLYLTNEQKKTVCFSLPKESAKISQPVIEVYREVKRELSAGERIRWTKNDKSKGLVNSETATVLKINKHHVHIQTAGGDVFKLDLRDRKFQHWEHAYACTVYAAQGQTSLNVIAHEESYTKLTTQRALYVILSRAKEKVTLFVDNKLLYLKALEQATGDKYTALDVVEKKDLNLPLDSSAIHENIPLQRIGENPLSQQSNQQTSSPLDSKEKIALPFSGSPSLNTGKTQTKPQPSSILYYDKEQVREALHHQIEHIVEKLLGEPTFKPKASEWRYGKKGSLSVTISGKNIGQWHDFEGGRGKIGGDIFALIEREMFVGFSAAMAIAAQWAGIAPHTEVNISIQPKKPIATPSKIKTEEDKQHIDRAKTLYEKAKPIKGTLAEVYLRKHRGIEMEKLPESLRFLPAKTSDSLPALIIKAQNNQGQIEAVQLIYLDKKTGKKAQVDVQKRQFGRMRFGAYGLIQEGKNDRILIAEGLETALSVAQANPETKVITTLSGGNLLNVDLPKDTKEVILCADNDKGKAHALQSLSPAIERFQKEGRTVSIVFPEITEAHIKQHSLVKNDTSPAIPPKIDFNDVHKTLGIEAVKQQTNTSEKIHQPSVNNETKPTEKPHIISHLLSANIENNVPAKYEPNIVTLIQTCSQQKALEST